MRRTRGRTAIRARLARHGTLGDGTLSLCDGRIDGIAGPHTAAARELWDEADHKIHAPVVAPGWIDLQVNGAFGIDLDTSVDTLQTLAQRILQSGVTSFLPTWVSSVDSNYPLISDSVQQLIRTVGETLPRAQVLGAHYEGPFLASDAAGTHAKSAILDADASLLRHFLQDPSLRMCTVAPERDGILAWIAAAVSRGCVVSLGHSNASAQQVDAAVRAGARAVTHLYNAMSAFHHRAPGMVGASLTDDRVCVGLIADLIHCDATAIELAWRCKGPRKIFLVTDAVSAAGMPAGMYTLAGHPIQSDGSVVRNRDGGLAGSALTMDRAVLTMAEHRNIGLSAALIMASETPARLLGLADRGRIEVGLRADLVVLDESGALRETWIAGERVWPLPA